MGCKRKKRGFLGRGGDLIIGRGLDIRVEWAHAGLFQSDMERVVSMAEIKLSSYF